MNIAIIIARKGSKRIKNKNIKKFHGFPVIKYSIDEAKKTNLFKFIYVSTDSNKIKKIAEKFGAHNFNLRPKKLSTDKSTTLDTVSWEVLYLEKKYNFNYVCCIYPAAPLIEAKYIKKGFKKLAKNNFDFVMSASKITNSVSKFFELRKNKIKLFINKKIEKVEKKNNLYYDSGQFYWAHKKVWIKKKKIFANNTSIIEIPRENSHDINNLDDWKFVEKLFKLRN